MSARLPVRGGAGEAFILESLKFLCAARNAILSTMSAILKSEEFVAVEAAVKAGIAPQPVVDAFNELNTLRAELEKLGESMGF